jgi:hypothetical protein
LTQNINGVYHPVVNNRNELLVSAFTASGYQLAQYKSDLNWKKITVAEFTNSPELYLSEFLNKTKLNETCKLYPPTIMW